MEAEPSSLHPTRQTEIMSGPLCRHFHPCETPLAPPLLSVSDVAQESDQPNHACAALDSGLGV